MYFFIKTFFNNLNFFVSHFVHGIEEKIQLKEPQAILEPEISYIYLFGFVRRDSPIFFAHFISGLAGGSYGI